MTTQNTKTSDQSVLPNRYSGDFEKRLIERIAERAESAGPQRSSMPRIGWKQLRHILLPVAAGVVLLLHTFGGNTRGESRIGVERAPMVSAQAAGLAPSAEQLIPRRDPVVYAAPAPAATAAPVEEETPTPSPGRRRLRQADLYPGAAATPCADCDRNAQLRAMGIIPATKVLFDATTDGAGYAAHVTADEQAEALVLNVGTRFTVAVTGRVRSSGSGVPITANVVTDVLSNGRVAIPAGAQLVGDAFVTTTDDRVQVVFSALVHKGTTTRISAISFDKDGQLGLQGKVVKKGRFKKTLGAAVRSGASLLSMGILGTDDAASRAVDSVVRDASQRLSTIEYAWERDMEKVVQLPDSAAATIFLRDDLSLSL